MVELQFKKKYSFFRICALTTLELPFLRVKWKYPFHWNLTDIKCIFSSLIYVKIAPDHFDLCFSTCKTEHSHVYGNLIGIEEAFMLKCQSMMNFEIINKKLYNQ